jgi:hypothetical protein
LVNQNKPKLVSMTTKKDNRGGPRPNSGRPPKILEIKLIEQMDAISVPEEIWKALLYKCQEGDTAAIKLWLSYRFGLPKQQIDVTTNGENITPPIQWISKNIAIETAKVIQDSDPLEVDSLELDYQDYQANQDHLDSDPQKEKIFI